MNKLCILMTLLHINPVLLHLGGGIKFNLRYKRDRLLLIDEVTISKVVSAVLVVSIAFEVVSEIKNMRLGLFKECILILSRIDIRIIYKYLFHTISVFFFLLQTSLNPHLK